MSSSPNRPEKYYVFGFDQRDRSRKFLQDICLFKTSRSIKFHSVGSVYPHCQNQSTQSTCAGTRGFSFFSSTVIRRTQSLEHSQNSEKILWNRAPGRMGTDVAQTAKAKRKRPNLLIVSPRESLGRLGAVTDHTCQVDRRALIHEQLRGAQDLCYWYYLKKKGEMP